MILKTMIIIIARHLINRTSSSPPPHFLLGDSPLRFGLDDSCPSSPRTQRAVERRRVDPPRLPRRRVTRTWMSTQWGGKRGGRRDGDTFGRDVLHRGGEKNAEKTPLVHTALPFARRFSLDDDGERQKKSLGYEE